MSSGTFLFERSLSLLRYISHDIDTQISITVGEGGRGLFMKLSSETTVDGQGLYPILFSRSGLNDFVTHLYFLVNGRTVTQKRSQWVNTKLIERSLWSRFTTGSPSLSIP